MTRLVCFDQMCEVSDWLSARFFVWSTTCLRNGLAFAVFMFCREHEIL